MWDSFFNGVEYGGDESKTIAPIAIFRGIDVVNKTNLSKMQKVLNIVAALGIHKNQTSLVGLGQNFTFPLNRQVIFEFISTKCSDKNSNLIKNSGFHELFYLLNKGTIQQYGRADEVTVPDNQSPTDNQNPLQVLYNMAMSVVNFVTPTDEPINDQGAVQVQNMNLFSDKVKKLYNKFSNKTINTLYNSLNTIETEYKDIYAHTPGPLI